MAHPTGESNDGVLRLDFDRRLIRPRHERPGCDEFQRNPRERRVFINEKSAVPARETLASSTLLQVGPDGDGLGLLMHAHGDKHAPTSRSCGGAGSRGFGASVHLASRGGPFTAFRVAAQVQSCQETRNGSISILEAGSLGECRFSMCCQVGVGGMALNLNHRSYEY